MIDFTARYNKISNSIKYNQILTPDTSKSEFAYLNSKIDDLSFHFDVHNSVVECVNFTSWDTPLIVDGNFNIDNYGTPVHFSNERFRGRTMNSDIADGTIFTNKKPGIYDVDCELILVLVLEPDPLELREIDVNLFRNGSFYSILNGDKSTAVITGATIGDVGNIYKYNIYGRDYIDLLCGDTVEIRLSYFATGATTGAEVTAYGRFNLRFIEDCTERIFVNSSNNVRGI